MAYNLATTELSNIFMTVEDPLNQDSMNPKFQLLRRNDIVINNLFSNTIGIWECRWYFDSSIKGYSIGDAVWLNTEDPDEFVKTRAASIKNYTDFNSQILNKLPEFNPKDNAIIEQYKTAMSGYSDSNLGKDVVLPPIFDIGDFKKPIQIAISLKSNNKSLLSDDTSWKKLFVDSEEDGDNIRRIIDDKEKYTVEQHLLNYHLSGHESNVKAKLKDYLNLNASISSLAYTGFPQSWQMHYSESMKNPLYGTDYVRYSIRKPYVLSGAVSQYQAVRYWNSGMMEHYGTIATNNEMFLTENGSILQVPFDWMIANDESGAKAYESGELAKSLTELLSTLETSDTLIPPRDNLINVSYEKKNVNIDGLQRARCFKNDRYNITIHPIFQDQRGILNNYIQIAYGSDGIVQKWNSNYLTNEILEKKNKLYFRMKSNTRVLPPYISYYAVGLGEF